MSDLVTEKLTQRVANLLEEVTEVNILIRRLDSTKETVNKINERNDAIHAAIVHIEKGLTLDDKRLIALEAQTAMLTSSLEAQKQQTELLRDTLVQQKRHSEQFEQTARALNQVVLAQEASINGHTTKKAEDLRVCIGSLSVGLVAWLVIVGVAQLVIVAIFYILMR
jgi:hypothetical protein